MKAMPAVLAALSGIFLILGIRMRTKGDPGERQLGAWCLILSVFLLACGFVLLVVVFTDDAV